MLDLIIPLHGDSDSKESASKAGVPGSVPGWGRSAGEGNGNPLQYSCWEYTLDRGAWQAPWEQCMGSQRGRHDWVSNTNMENSALCYEKLDLLMICHKISSNYILYLDHNNVLNTKLNTKYEIVLLISNTKSWRRKWQPTPVPLPGEFLEQRSLVGQSP